MFVKRKIPTIRNPYSQVSRRDAGKSAISLSDPKITSLFSHTDDSLPSITPTKAVGIPAVLTCIDTKSSDIAMLPRHLYKRTRDGREKVSDHDQLYLIKTSPHPVINAYDFWRVMHINKYLWGNAFALKHVNRHGRAEWYEILKPREIDVYEDEMTGEIIYYDTKRSKSYTPDQIIHLKDISFDGIVGHSRITLARIAFQKGYAIDQFAADLYHNKTNLAGWISIEDWIEDDDRVQMLADSWKRKYAGTGKSDTAILMGGSEYHPITMKMTDAQFIENQKMSLQQIAMLFRIPLTRLGVMEDANRSNMEATFREYATFSLQSEVVQFEQELTAKSLRPTELNSMFWKVELKGLLRGDTQAQAEWIRTNVSLGIMSPNEIRELDDYPALPYGDSTFMPLNVIPANRMEEYIDSIISKAIARSLQHNTPTHNEKAIPNPEVFSTNGHTKN